MTKQIEVLTVTLTNPAEVKTFREFKDVRYVEGVLRISEEARATTYPIHRIVNTVSVVEDVE